MEVNITRTGTYIDGLSVELIKKIRKYFIISIKSILGHFVHTHNWELKGKRLYIPRFGSLLLTNKFDDITYKNTIKSTNSLPHIQSNDMILNDMQDLIINEIMSKYFTADNVEAGRAGLILNLQAGYGKSYIAMALISMLKCRTLIVTHNFSILDQWSKILKQYFVGTQIGEYHGTKHIYGDIVIGIIDSLVAADSKLADFETMWDFYASFDFVIFDEAHIYTSTVRSRIYKIAQAPYMLGLSATPEGRGDGMEKIIKWGNGPILVAEELNGFSTEDIPFKGHVTKIIYHGPPQYTEHLINEKLGIASVPKMIKQLCADPCRLRMVLDLVMEQYNNGMNILVFADNREYLGLIQDELNKEYSGTSCHMLTNKDEEKQLESIRIMGGSKKSDLELAFSKQIILTTYQYFSVGVSIPRLNALILATPRKNNSRQFINRIFRLGGDYTIERKIIDIVDTKISLKNQWYTRTKYYNEQEFPITPRTIKYTDIAIHKDVKS
jgi:superfamily II DNA or RNA helicase